LPIPAAEGHLFAKIISLRYISLRRSTVVQRQRRLFSTVFAREMPFKLPTLPEVAGVDPTRAALDSFKISIAKRVADALPPLTLEQVYQGVDYGKKGVDFTIALPRFRLPGKVDVLAKTVIDQVCAASQCSTYTLLMLFHSSKRTTLSSPSRMTRRSYISC
jgi:hypothetical protein